MRHDNADTVGIRVIVIYRRILREPIRSVRLFHICVCVLLIRSRAKKTRREHCFRLFVAGIRRSNVSVTSLSSRLIECDTFDTLARGRSRQAFGNLCFAREVPFACRIRRIPKLVGKRVKSIIHELFICSGRRLRIETRVVRRQRDGAACRCVLDAEVAAEHHRRRRSFVCVKHARIAAVVVDRDVLVVLLEDYACMIGSTAAFQRGEMAA